MIDLFEGNNLARMDPSSFGIWLNLDSIQDSDDELLHLTRLGFATGIVDEQQIRYWNSCSDQTRKDLALHTFSLYSHEARHYHDLVLTPYGSMLKRQFCNVQMQYLFWLEYLMVSGDEESIYVPLIRWVSDAELLEHTFPDLLPPKPYTVSFARKLETMRQKVHLFKNGTFNAFGPDATDILEGLAIVVQEIDVLMRFGESGLSQFHESMHQRDEGKRYYLAPTFITKALTGDVPVEVSTYLLLAALCGDFQGSKGANAPKDLLLELLVWMKGKGHNARNLESLDDTIQIVDQYFKEEHDATLAMHLEKALLVNEQFERNFRRDLAGINRKPPAHAELIVEEFAQFRLVQKELVRAFLADPMAYCSPYRYLRTQRSLLPPMIFLQTNGGWLARHAEPLFHIHCETSVPWETLENAAKSAPDWVREVIERELDQNYGRPAIRLAHIMSLNPVQVSDPSYRIYHAGAKQIKIAQELYDLVSLLRLLLDGPDGIPRAQVELSAATFHMLGLKVYSKISELHPGAQVHPGWMEKQLQEIEEEAENRMSVQEQKTAQARLGVIRKRLGLQSED